MNIELSAEDEKAAREVGERLAREAFEKYRPELLDAFEPVKEAITDLVRRAEAAELASPPSGRPARRRRRGRRCCGRR